MISKIILGTVQFGVEYGINNISGKPSREEIVEIFKYCQKKGIKTLDSAESYGDSQYEIGDFHKDYEGLEFDVITKFTVDRSIFTDYYLTENVIRNLAKLKVKRLEGYLFHNIEYGSEFDLVLKQLIALKKKQIIKKIGVSVYSNSDIEKLALIPELDVFQFSFNMLENESKRINAINVLKSYGKEIHIRSVFLQGLFFKDINSIPTNLLKLKPYLIEINNIAKRANLSIEALALQYVLSKKYIDKIIIGVESLSQLKRNIDSIENKLSDTFINEIDSIYVKDSELLNPTNW